jgi:hypothetical protein
MTAIHTGTQDCKACDPLRPQLAELGLPTCMGWQRVTGDSEGDDAPGGCADCGAAITSNGKRGRPAKRCDACRAK